MKPTSVIFLILSVVLVICGFAAMGVAKQMAASEGISLTVGNSDDIGNHVYTYEYDADSIGKITVDVKDASVHIIGGAAKPYVEIINFPDGMYEFSAANRNLTIGNNTDFTSFEGLTSVVMNFKGLRSLINYYNIMDRERIINVYLCDEFPVNVIDCQTELGEVSIQKSTFRTDFNVKIGEGDLNVSDISTESLLYAIVENGDVSVKDSVINNLKLEMKKGSASLDCEVRQMEAVIENGSLHHANPYGIERYNMRLSADKGRILYADEDIGGFFENMSLPTTDFIDITVGTGDITLRSITAPAS